MFDLFFELTICSGLSGTFVKKNNVTAQTLYRKGFFKGTRYLGDPSMCKTITIPFILQKHFFSCIVDFCKKSITICDTLRTKVHVAKI